jgi:hypothetical protein
VRQDEIAAPHWYFARPGEVTVSAAALEFARKFDKAARAAMSDTDWIVTFEWILECRVRYRPDGPWEDMGPGLSLTTYARSDTPANVIQRVGELEFAIKVPKDIYEQAAERLIDVDETAFSKLALR